MAKLSYEDQVSLIVSALQKEISQLDELPADKAKTKARNGLIDVGIVDKDGRLTPHYAALRKQYV